MVSDPTDSRMNYYAAAGTTGTNIGTSSGPSMEIRKISLDWDEVERTKEIMKHKMKYAYVNMPPGTTGSLARKAFHYRTMNSTTKKN